MKQTIAEFLREFREQYNLTQLKAAEWTFLAPGTYRDYEQGRSEPTRIIEEGIRARIAQYAHDYERLVAKQLEEEFQTVSS